MLYIFVIILNILDIFLTNVAISLGAEELNPWVNNLMIFCGDFWWIYKLVLVSVAVGVLYFLRENRLSKISIQICAGVYFIIVLYQIVILFI